MHWDLCAIHWYRGIVEEGHLGLYPGKSHTMYQKGITEPHTLTISPGYFHQFVVRSHLLPLLEVTSVNTQKLRIGKKSILLGCNTTHNGKEQDLPREKECRPRGCRVAWMPCTLAKRSNATVTCCPRFSAQGTDLRDMCCPPGDGAPMLDLFFVFIFTPQSQKS